MIALRDLYIVDAHCRLLHAGINETLTELRQRFWIPKIRARIKGIIKKCVICNKVQSKALASPIAPPLPCERMIQNRPFYVTGIDYTGFILIRDRNQLMKVYIALFTCAVTRAIHLEIVMDNGEIEFMRAFTRFVCRRSYPAIIYSDNASTFCRASLTLQEIANKPRVQEYLTNDKLNWKLITPRAVWHGGMWERMIGLTKNALKKCVGQSVLNLSEIQTLIV